MNSLACPPFAFVFALGDPAGFFESLGLVVLWAFLGVVLLVAAMKVFDWLTPGKLAVQVFTDRNNAAAIVYGAAFIGLAIIIASAMH